MEETKLEKLARLSGKVTSKALAGLARSGFDLRGKMSAPISRVPRRAPPPKAKDGQMNPDLRRREYFMADPETIYNWRRLDNRLTTSGHRPTRNWLISAHWASATSSTSDFTPMKKLCRMRRQVSAVSA